jgi:hypothetical protein
MCNTAPHNVMQSWWLNSPFWNYFFYMGGVNAACPTSGITASYVDDWTNQGWSLVPIWVGPQAPYGTCTTRSFTSYMSADPATARSQGKNEADAAISRANSLGFAPGAVIAYDLEGGFTLSSTCLTAVQQFITGWDAELTYVSIIYSNPSILANFTSLSSVPAAIWGAGGSSADSVWNLAGLNNGNWSYDQRHFQYSGTHPETWGGYSLSVDDDCSNGPLSPARSRLRDPSNNDEDPGSEGGAADPSEDPACN